MNLSVSSVTQNARPLCAVGPSGCRASELCRLGGCADRAPRLRTYARGGQLAGPGESRVWILAVRRGLVATSTVLPDGRRQILCLNLPGDVICCMPGERTENWHEALAASEVCEIDRSLWANGPAQSPELSALMLAMLHDRLQRSAAHLALLGRFDAMERVCCFLIDMTQRIGRRPNGKWLLELPMSREDIADYLGLNPDTVGRVLKRMRDEGLIGFSSPTQCEIPSVDRLRGRTPIVSGNWADRAFSGIS